MTAMPSDGEMPAPDNGKGEPGMTTLIGRLIDESRSVVSAEVTM